MKQESKEVKIDICPIHKVQGTIVPPKKHDKKRNKIIITFQCQHEHTFQGELDAKTKGK